jgi:biotin synthase
MSKITWNKDNVASLFELPVFELISRAYACHKKHSDIQEMEYCTLSSIKTGCCPEDCAYCPQSGHHNTGLKKEKLLGVGKVLTEAKQAKENGAKRFCMGAAWRNPSKKDFPKVVEIVKAVKELGLETCATLGSLNEEQAVQLKAAGLDYYNHNIDTSPDYFPKIITTRTFDDRITTIINVDSAGINVCCGGILGMGENRDDRINFLLALDQLPATPKSIPINQLIPIKGTPLENQKPLDDFEFIKTIAVARIMFPKPKIRLSAGRENMSNEMQAWCFMAGANSIFIGDKLLTAKNPAQNKDMKLMKMLGIRVPETAQDSLHVE